MVLEQALIAIRPGTGKEFETALDRATEVIRVSSGFVSLRLHRGIETPERYLLLVEWETLDDHLVGFRESDAFRAWRALIGPYFASPPEVVHFHLPPVTVDDRPPVAPV